MSRPQLEEGQIVSCNVLKIDGTIVIVKLEDYNIEGSITFPEIAPGRIRNIRDFAFPGKKIVCKVLKVRPTTIELSLRRVKVNERNDFNDRYRKEKSYSALLRTIIGEKSAEVIEKIKQAESSIFDFIENAKENSKILEKYLSKEQVERITKILSGKKSKETTLSIKFSLSSKSPAGITLIKSIIKQASEGIDAQTLEVSYIAAGKYLIKLKTKDLKQGDNQLNKMKSTIETLAKKQGCVFQEEKA